MTSLHQVRGRAATDPSGSDDDVVTHDRSLLKMRALLSL
jgi:hypothetical protein